MQNPFKHLAVLCALVSVCAGTMVVQHSRANVPSGFVSNGAAPADDPITLRVALTANNVAGLEEKLMSISDPTNAEYGQFLTQAEVKSFLEPTAATTAAFNAWAAANGLVTTVISPNDDWVEFTIPVAKANALFDTTFTTFTHSASGQKFVRTLSFSLPSEMVDRIATVHPSTTFDSPNVRLAPEMYWNRNKAEKRQVNASCNSRNGGTVTPTCLQELYGIPTTPATEKSNTMLVTGYVSQFPQTADLSAFLKANRADIPSTTTFTVETLDRGTDPQGANEAGVEADLDIEYTIGIATGVPETFLTVGGSFSTALLDTTTFLHSTASPPSVMTTSYGDSESAFTPSLATQICNGYMALGTRGISVLFASGDGGVRGNHDTTAECASNTFIPTFPAACPFVTAVGSTIGISPETAVNFTGGGFSNQFARPSYQNTVVPAFLTTVPSNFAGVFNRNGRGYPDVAVQGWNFEVVAGGESGLVGGTSASSPTFAGIIALINDRLVAAGKPVLGFLNTWIYTTASSAFTDITSGKNTGFVCAPTVSAFTATTGWDATTGFGTPIFASLLTAAGL